MIRRSETWLAFAGVLLIVLGTCGVLTATPALLAVGAGLVGLPAALGSHMDAQGRTDAPGGYSVMASNEQLAVQRYVSDPNAEVEDLERDLDRAMRGIEPQPPQAAADEAMRGFLARAKAGA